MNAATDLRDRVRFLQQASRNLTFLKEDHKLQREGWIFHRAADFAAIHSYMYKDSLYDSQAATPFGGWSPRTFARDQLMLSVIFAADAEKVLLIPPYSTELMNHIQSVQSNAYLTSELLKRGRFHRDKLLSLINDSAEFKKFIQTKSDDEAGQERAIELARELFPEMYAVVQTVSVDAMGSLQKLLSGGVLVDAHESLPILDGFSYEAERERSDWWYRSISGLRKGERLYATFMDGLACAYFERAQRLLKDSKIRIFFISPSTTVGRAITIAHRTGAAAETPCLRDYHYFMLSRMYAGQSEKLEEVHRVVRDLLMQYRRLSENHSTDRLMDSAEDQWRQCENLTLSGSQAVDLRRGAGSHGQVAKAISMIYQIAEHHPEKFEAHINQLIETIKNDVAEVQAIAPILHVVGVPGIRELDHEHPAEFVVLPGMIDDFPVALRIGEPRLRRLIKTLAERSRAEIQRTIDLEFTELLLPPISQERLVLAGYLSALVGRYKDASSYLERAMECKPDTHLTELGYVMAMVCRKLHKAEDAEVYIERALAIDGEDSRLLFEASSVFWLKALYGAQDLPQISITLHKALSLGEEALTRAHSNGIALQTMLFPRIHNTLAFLLAEIALRNKEEVAANLDVSEKHLEAIRRGLPEHDWTSRLFDTRAWVAYVRATLLSPDNKLELLHSARQDLERAIGMETLKKRRDYLDEHLSLVREAIARIG